MRGVSGNRSVRIILISAVLLGLLLPIALDSEEARADSWTREADAGFTGGFNQMQLNVSATAVFDDGGGSKLYAGTFNLQGTGCQIWRCDGPDPDDWVQVNVSGFGDPNNIEVTGMTVFSHGGITYLYAATRNGASGCEIWRTAGLGGVPHRLRGDAAPSPAARSALAGRAPVRRRADRRRDRAPLRLQRPRRADPRLASAARRGAAPALIWGLAIPPRSQKSSKIQQMPKSGGAPLGARA